VVSVKNFFQFQFQRKAHFRLTERALGPFLGPVPSSPPKGGLHKRTGGAKETTIANDFGEFTLARCPHRSSSAPPRTSLW
jgi:hypothetical protein